MDFASLKNNALYGPLRILAGALLAYAVAKGWINVGVIDADTLAAIGVAGLTVWSIWQQNHSAKKADLVTALAVQSAAVSQPIGPAAQKAVAAAAKDTVKALPEKAITEILNQSQLNP
jgi:hypothetical protein